MGEKLSVQKNKGNVLQDLKEITSGGKNKCDFEDAVRCSRPRQYNTNV